MQNLGRNHVLDLLKALLIALSCMEHFSGFLNVWYTDYFRIQDIENTGHSVKFIDLYGKHYFALNQAVSADTVQGWFHRWLIPWLPHLYIALAGFNLGRKDPQSLRHRNGSALTYFIILIGLFILENFLVAPHFGQAISVNPIMIWMFVLLALNWICSRLSVVRTSVVFGIALGLQLLQNLPLGFRIPSFFELLQRVHPWSYHTEFLPYFISGLLGFLIHRGLRQSNVQQWLRRGWMGVAAAISVGTFFKIRDLFVYDPSSILDSHDRIHPDPFGLVFILSTLVWILLWVYSYEFKTARNKLKLATYISTYSLSLFLIHRVLFVRLIAPVRLHVGSYFGLTLTNHWYELFVYFGAVLLIHEGLRRGGVLGPILNPARTDPR
jgi:hypothetical protein